MKIELYVFQCKKCGFIYAEPYDVNNRFSKYPPCPDCGYEDVEIYNGEISEDLQKAINEYNEENGIEV